MGTSSLAAIGLVGGATNAYGQMQQASANAATQNYNAQVADNNSAIATQEAAWAGEEGDQAASNSELATRSKVGGIIANQGASGVEVGSGSFQDVQKSASEVGMLDAMTIRSNAARQAYGYQVQATSETGQAALDRYAAKNDLEAGKIKSAGTILGSAGSNSAFSNFLNGSSVLNTGSRANAFGELASDADVLAGI